MTENTKTDGSGNSVANGNKGDTAGLNEASAGGKPQAETRAAPSMRIIGQYLKDLSFENPNAPQSLMAKKQPQLNINVNVNAKALSQTDYEVEIHLDAKANTDDAVAFGAELIYAGVFRLENIPQDAMQPVILVECPRMLFPFARQILADATRNGGFPPLMLDPIDFAGMFQQRLAQQKAGAAPTSGGQTGGGTPGGTSTPGSSTA